MESVGAYEAKTHLPRLLERVQSGESITITKHGVPVAVLHPPNSESSRDIESVIADLLAFRESHRGEGNSVRELIEDGRRQMENTFVIDNSVVMSWCFQDKSNDYADAVLATLVKWTAVVPSIWPLKVVDVLLVGERKKRLEQTDSAQFLTLLSQLPISVEDDRVERRMKE